MTKEREDRKSVVFLFFLLLGRMYICIHIYIFECVCCFLAVLEGVSGMCIFACFSVGAVSMVASFICQKKFEYCI